MRLRRILALFAFVFIFSAAFAPNANATIINFTASLSGSQEVPPNGSTASGIATLVLDTNALTQDYSIALFGLDLDGLQTPGDTTDDVTGLHFHNAAFGINGPIDFGVIGLAQDTDDLMVDAVAGTVSGTWEETDMANEALSLNIGMLLAGNFYINVHTSAFPAGEIRGQIFQVVSEPATLPLVALAMLGLALAGRRRPN